MTRAPTAIRRRWRRCSRRAWRRRAGAGVERGSATLELALVFPVFLLLLLSAVQAGLYFYARAIALSAAQEGVDTARLQRHTLDQGATAARRSAVRASGGSLHHVAVTTSGSTPTTVRITVTGTAASLLPGLDWSVSQQAAGARERFTAPTLASP